MNRVFFWMVCIGVPFSVLGSFYLSSTLMFIVYSLTIVALSAYIGRATESLAIVTGPRLGGLLNATFGNAVELIISIFALQAGLVNVVLASLTGSVIGNLLLVAGLSFFVGGLRFKRQTFNVHDARHHSGLLIFAVLVAFVIPEIFSQQVSEETTYTMSIAISIVLIVFYALALIFRLVTHRGVYSQPGDEPEEEETPEWSARKATIILGLTTAAVAYISEQLVHTLEDVARTFGWSELFIGIILVAIIGNAAEHASAVLMAYKNRMNVAIEIALGSTIQIAMFVVPLLVFLSFLIGQPMALVFTIPELIAMIVSIFLVISVTNDGDTNWFEGALLLGAYIILAIGFYFL
ncbi:calcium/proton exchanger [Aureibacillus halotolerans]|uniref:Ca(2+)/H(+) antiporter n=1 Tax=Aureibacillus halotolerans TaxID=1508390 RepID=A0A4R6TW59_9BACI|nr:calcium/proton exchanger [Aureibacillus halotolerans]TDQ37476.1 Ca2+:H+ antiporter [Aureibacillus halotolerans]